MCMGVMFPASRLATFHGYSACVLCVPIWQAEIVIQKSGGEGYRRHEGTSLNHAHRADTGPERIGQRGGASFLVHEGGS